MFWRWLVFCRPCRGLIRFLSLSHDWRRGLLSIAAPRLPDLKTTSQISIVDLEVFYRVGVPDAERAQPQRLLLTIGMEADFTAAAQSDGIADTIDYYAVTQRLLKLGEGREWKLIEKLAADIAGLILAEFKPLAVTVEVKKFIIPEARHVAVTLTQAR
jgi:dihydroneopterin aldolase